MPVADSPDRENEADVVFAARGVSAEWVAWTIRHSSGYLCAPMPAERADALELPLMVPHSQDPRRTAYTVTVDAASGVTTGISAEDRARTLRVLADPGSGSGDLIRPGHVLPLRAVPGGVGPRGIGGWGDGSNPNATRGDASPQAAKPRAGVQVREVGVVKNPTVPRLAPQNGGAGTEKRQNSGTILIAPVPDVNRNFFTDNHGDLVGKSTSN